MGLDINLHASVKLDLEPSGELRDMRVSHDLEDGTYGSEIYIGWSSF